jgi:hypothetical protein
MSKRRPLIVPVKAMGFDVRWIVLVWQSSQLTYLDKNDMWHLWERAGANKDTLHESSKRLGHSQGWLKLSTVIFQRL